MDTSRKDKELTAKVSSSAARLLENKKMKIHLDLYVVPRF